jgi:hypothetical protein
MIFIRLVPHPVFRAWPRSAQGLQLAANRFPTEE